MNTLEVRIQNNRSNDKPPIPKDFSYSNIHTTLRTIEQIKRPNNLEEAINIWDQVLSTHMQYDAMNYAVSARDTLEENKGLWVDRIDPNKLGLTRDQSLIIHRRLIELRTILSTQGRDIFAETIDTLIKDISSDNISDFVNTTIRNPTVQTLLGQDPVIWNNMGTGYRKQTIPQLLMNGVGNCKVLSIMSKMVLETGNIRWGLGIRKIDIEESSDGHVYLIIHTHKGVHKYDPTAILYYK